MYVLSCPTEEGILLDYSFSKKWLYVQHFPLPSLRMARDYTQPFSVFPKHRTSQGLSEDICPIFGRLHMVYADLTQRDCLACIMKLNSDVLAESRIHGISQILNAALVIHKNFDSPRGTPYFFQKGTQPRSLLDS
jgi:hypothetical protein